MTNNYDAWLEQPYQDSYAQDDAYVAWCEENNLDPTENHNVEYERALADAEDDYYSDLAEAQAEDAHFDRY